MAIPICITTCILICILRDNFSLKSCQKFNALTCYCSTYKQHEPKGFYAFIYTDREKVRLLVSCI